MVVAQDKKLVSAPDQAAEGAGADVDVPQRHAGRDDRSPAVAGPLKCAEGACLDDVGLDAVNLTGHHVRLGQLGGGQLLTDRYDDRYFIGRAAGRYLVADAAGNDVGPSEQLVQVALLSQKRSG